MDVRLPNLGEGADSGVVVSVQVKEGDSIQKGQTVIELESGKAVAPIPAPAAGKVTSVRVKEGDKISAGAILISLEGAGGGAEPAAAPAAASPKASPKKKPSAAKVVEPEVSEDEGEDEVADADVQSGGWDETADGQPVPASPELRRMARLLGIPLRRVTGSERGGRIVFEDVRAYIARLHRLASRPKASGPVGRAVAAPAAPSIDFSQFGPVVRKPLSSLRKVISQRMLESWNNIPHVTQFEDADISGLLELRKKHLAAYEAKGARLTVTGLVLKAVVATLQKHPIFNSSIDDQAEECVIKEYIHLGIAVDTEAGLIVPVIRDAHKKSILQLSLDLQSLADKARDRKTSMEELKGGSFTISNQGGIGGAHFTPIVNRPEVAILGLGKGLLKPVVREKQIVARTMLPLALSYDHRLIDGGSAARFIADLVSSIENFSEADVKL
ncbi:MAG: 2-oxo acid dehydrogenase subunit E2 [Verrucomicrobiales bacterium]|nr:2-oxo acid dehydrogenase subunit E2 [Verrucomicrobiales bacterium]